MQEKIKEQMTGELTEIKKKSELACEDRFALDKLVVSEPLFLPAVYKEAEEEITFTYDLCGKKPVETLWQETREKQYQFLINFAKLEEIYQRYHILLTMDNLYYDENQMPYVKHRDLYKQGEQAELSEFVFFYQSFIGGMLGKRYTVEQLQQSGLEVLKKEGFMKPYLEIGHSGELAELLRREKQRYLAHEKKTKQQVSKRLNRIKTVLAVASTLLLAVCAGFLGYETKTVLPFKESVIRANEAYISGDYVGCTDSMSGIAVEKMDLNTKYILAVSYAKSENLKRNEISSIIDRLSLYSNEKELEYWICLGRMEMTAAQDLAQSLSDDQLLMYAYMKELNQLEGNTAIAGGEKQSRISELESNIKSLGEKYTEK